MNRQERLKLLRAHHVLKEGATGEEVKKFLADIRGDKGDTGEKGEKGLTGDRGLPGLPGRDGKDGLKGETGAKGLRGDRGEKGETGQKGSKGLVWRSQWLVGITYRQDDAVYSYGSAYICIKEHKSTNRNHPNTGEDWGTYWAILAERGETGPGGAQGPAGPSGTGGAGGGIALAYGGNTLGAMATITSGTALIQGGNNITLSQNGQSVTIVGGAGGAGAALKGSGTYTQATGTVEFANSNGVTFGLSNNGTMTASVATNYQSQGAYLTTARASNDGIGLNTAGTNMTWTANSSGLSINAGGYAGTGFTSASTAGTDIVMTHGTNGLSAGVPKYLTTAQPVGAYLTTARASTDAIGLNTAQSNVTWTANSSGLSLDNRGYAGTGTSVTNATMTLNSNGLQFNGGAYLTTAMASNRGTDFVQAGAAFAGTNASGTIASNGISVSVAAPGGGAAVNFSGGTTSNNLQSVVFSNSNGVSFGLNGSTMTGSHNGITSQTNQTVGLYGLGNTTQNSSTTLDARTMSFNGLGGATVGYSNGSIQMSAPAASSLVASGNITFSSAGSTITASVGNPYISRFEMKGGAVSSISNGSVAQGSLSLQQMYVPLNVTATAFAIAGNLTMATNTSATTASVNYSMNVGIYGLSGSTLSLLSSGSANNGFQWSQSASTTANTSINGLRIMTAPINANITPGQYWVGVALSSATTYTGGTFSLHGDPSINTSASNAAFSPIGGATGNNGAIMYQGIFTAATNAMPSSIVGSADINMTSASNVARANYYGRFYNGNY